MEDRFRFRVWYQPGYKESRMLYDAEQTYDYMRGEPENIPENCFGQLLDDKDYIVMQCTGLKDKNGTLIYEGDIVERENIQGKKRGVVEFNENLLHFRATNMSLFSLIHRAEVIGNIYENFELLEAK